MRCTMLLKNKEVCKFSLNVPHIVLTESYISLITIALRSFAVYHVTYVTKYNFFLF